MPAIGTLNFSNDDGLDSGIGLLLNKPPKKRVDLKYNNCQIFASPDTPYIICRFNRANSLEEAYSLGTKQIQEALDVMSMTGRGDLVTRDGDNEFIVWWSLSGKRSIALITTVTFSMSVGPISLTVKDANGNVVPPKPVVPKHHIGFRFYRLSQVSDDLYDAYRNMYLAFESLLSSHFPKTQRREIDWLRQSLSLSASDLGLTGLVPSATIDPVEEIINVIYSNARLPLFHAKDGKAYFAPVDDTEDRKVVASALTMLTQIVSRMADKWFSARRISGSVNLNILEQHHRKLFEESHFVFTDNPNFDLSENLTSESIVAGIPFPASFNEKFGAETKHNISGILPTSKLKTRGRLHALYLVNEESTQIGFSPDTTIDLDSFDELQVILFVRESNANVPKYLYSR